MLGFGDFGGLLTCVFAVLGFLGFLICRLLCFYVSKS